MKALKVLYMIAGLLLIVGGLNWGLVGFFDYNLVDAIFGAGSTGSAVIYDIVGISALFILIVAPMKKNMHMKNCMKSDGMHKMDSTEEAQ